MRYLSFFLAILIIGLSGVPNINFNRHTEKLHSCCKKDKEIPAGEKQKRDCCENSCNPFLNCCGMMGFVVEQTLAIKQNTSLSSRTCFDFYVEPVSKHCVDIWQPPKTSISC